MAHRFLILATLFLCGLVIMGLELLGFRLLAVYFGYSNYVFGSHIGVVMAVLAAGYWLGGRWVDRAPRPVVFFRAVLLADAWLWLMAGLYPYLLRAVQTWPIVIGTMAASIALFGPAMLLLSMAGPFAIRLLAIEGAIGTTAGQIYALSTVGSLVGTFATSFWAIPTLGSRFTFLALTALIGLPAAAGLWRGRARRSLALLAAAAGLLVPPPPLGPKVLAHVESAYSDLSIVETSDGLQLSVGVWMSSFLAREGILSPGYYYDYLAVLPALTEPRSVLILGMGGGTTVRQYREAFPEAVIDAVEIDPAVVDLAARHFGVESGERIRIHVGDARPFLARAARRWDVIQVDLFQHGPHVPFYTVTREFFGLVRDHLAPGGLMIMNVLAPFGDRVLLDPIARTIGEVFPALFHVPRPHNTLVAAFPEPVALETVRERLRTRAPAALRQVAEPTARALEVLRPLPGAPVLTDDWAPVEPLQHGMLQRFKSQYEFWERLGAIKR